MRSRLLVAVHLGQQLLLIQRVAHGSQVVEFLQVSQHACCAHVVDAGCGKLRLALSCVYLCLLLGLPEAAVVQGVRHLRM